MKWAMDVERTMEFILEQTGQTAAMQAHAEVHFTRQIAQIDTILRRLCA